MDHYNKLELDSNFICRAAAADEKNLSSSYRNPEFEHQLLRHLDDVSSYNIETIRRMMFDMMQDLNMMTDTNPDTGSIESSFSNHKESPTHHPNFGGEHELLVPVSRRRTSSVPLYVEVKDSSMTDEGNDDDDVLSVGHLSVVHADSGYEVTSVDLQQMVHHICSSSQDQFVNHCLQERQRHQEGYPNSVVYLHEIVPLPFRRPSANGKSLMNRWKMRDVKEVLCVKNNASTAKQEHDINAEEAAEEAELWLSATSLLSALSEDSPMTLSPSSSFNASNRSWCSYNRKMRDVKEVLCVNNNTSTAKQEHDINAEEAAEEAELWLSATSLLSALSEDSPMTLSPSSSFNASNRSWSLYNLPVTETLSLPANWRFYPEQEKAEQEEDASLTTQRRGNAATPPLLSVTTEKASSSAAAPPTPRSTQDDKKSIKPTTPFLANYVVAT